MRIAWFSPLISRSSKSARLTVALCPLIAQRYQLELFLPLSEFVELEKTCLTPNIKVFPDARFYLRDLTEPFDLIVMWSSENYHLRLIGTYLKAESLQRRIDIFLRWQIGENAVGHLRLTCSRERKVRYYLICKRKYFAKKQ